MDKKVVIVTGGSSGIGLESARALAEKGCTVYTFSRHEFSCPGLHHIVADVTDEASVITAVQRVLKQEGRIDILINNAGAGISGAIEFTESGAAHKQMEILFFGAVNCTRAVLGAMRERGKGRIVNISSMAAPAAIPFQAFYSAAKAAVNAYTCALRNEVRPYGITACAVMPGDIRTGFTDARDKSAAGDEEYGGRISASVATMEKDEREGSDPKQAGRRIAGIALKKSVKPLYTIDFISGAESILFRLLPGSFSNFIVGKMYAK